MAENENFTGRLAEAINKKAGWFDTNVLPQTLESYRTVKGYLTNLYGIFKHKGFIQDDPYKHEKKIVKVEPVEDTPFLETERAVIVGARLSDYDNMLDYITSYVRFTVEDLSLDLIKKLVTFTNSIAWISFSTASTKPTTKAIAEIVNSIRNGSDTMSINMMNDIVDLLTKEVGEINKKLKLLTDFQRERYKLTLRTKVIEAKDFDAEKAKVSAMAAMAQIKKTYSAVMGKQPFYTELAGEVVAEEFGPNKEKYRAALIKKLEVPEEEKKKEHKAAAEDDQDPHELLMGAVRLLGSVSSQFDVVARKLEENKTTIQNQQNSFIHRLAAAIRKAFGLKEKAVEYRVPITESITKTTRNENININNFIAETKKRAKVYASISLKTTPGYIKLDHLEDIKILEFLNKQLAECQKAIILLTALDTFFKATINAQSQVKGMKIEISAIKGIIHKTSQEKADYALFAQEASQMKDLGIKPEETKQED